MHSEQWHRAHLAACIIIERQSSTLHCIIINCLLYPSLVKLCETGGDNACYV